MTKLPKYYLILTFVYLLLMLLGCSEEILQEIQMMGI